MSKINERYGPQTELALDTWVKLARAFSTFNKKTSENIRAFGLTLPQFSVIEALGHKGPLKVGEICEKMLVSGGNMTLVLDNLEKHNLVERVHSREDRRAIIIRLTKEGEELFNKIFGEHAEYISNLMSVLSEDEQKKLGGILKKLGKSVKGTK